MVVGVAVPGPFDYDAGVSAMTHKLAPLRNVDLRGELSAALGLPPQAFAFLNDAAAFLLGEWWAGAARARRRAMGVTLGTGLGSAYLDEGKIVTGEGELYTRPFRGAPVEQTDLARGRPCPLRLRRARRRADRGARTWRRVARERRLRAARLRPRRVPRRAGALLRTRVARAGRVDRGGLGSPGGRPALPARPQRNVRHEGRTSRRCSTAGRRAPRGGARAMSAHAQVEELRRRRLAAGARPLRDLTVAEARAIEEAEVARRAAPDDGVRRGGAAHTQPGLRAGGTSLQPVFSRGARGRLLLRRRVGPRIARER